LTSSRRRETVPAEELSMKVKAHIKAGGVVYVGRDAH
jgi:hypothetical protein